MVRWLDPRVLADAALRVALSAVFGAYADKREIQATRPARCYGYVGEAPLWIDYAADLGDGFDATYAVASTLAAQRLPLGDGDERHDTERGRLLVLGGDQVYPTAKRSEYENRFLSPYRAALPCTPPGREPHLFAIPGNHDWYDGLTNFLRIFAQQRWIGGWRTRQTRSYFALRLPACWWLWGIDIQFDTFIDQPQLEYFAEAARAMRDGDRVILVTGKPSWVDVPPEGATPESYRNLAYVEEKIVRANGGRIAVTLSGDSHHYARYSENGGDGQKITAGGGGAYMSSTHHLPAELHLPGLDSDRRTRFDRAGTYPDARTSRRLRWGALRLPGHTPGLARAIGGVYALLALTLYTAVAGDETDVGGSADAQGFWGLLEDAIGPGSVIASVVLLAVLVVFAGAPADRGRGRLRFVRRLPAQLAGALHALGHVVLAWPATVLAIELVTALGLDRFWALAAVLVALYAVGRLLGALLFGLYLVLADMALGRSVPGNANNVFACQSIIGHKCFLRMRLDPDGSLTIFPVGLETVPTDWEAVPDAEAGAPWLRARGAGPAPHLIEGPIRLPATRRPDARGSSDGARALAGGRR